MMSYLRYAQHFFIIIQTQQCSYVIRIILKTYAKLFECELIQPTGHFSVSLSVYLQIIPKAQSGVALLYGSCLEKVHKTVLSDRQFLLILQRKNGICFITEPDRTVLTPQISLSSTIRISIPDYDRLKGLSHLAALRAGLMPGCCGDEHRR